MIHESMNHPTAKTILRKYREGEFSALTAVSEMALLLARIDPDCTGREHIAIVYALRIVGKWEEQLAAAPRLDELT